VIAAAVALLALAASPVRVGSKSFTESVLLGELAAGAIRSTSAPVVHRQALGGTRIVWSALLRGEIDVYPEYTGTVAREILSLEGSHDEPALRAALDRHGVAMTRSLGFEDTYAVGMRRGDAARLSIRSISDLARHPELRLAFTNEFMDRSDGWPALRARYDLPHVGVRGLDHDVAYKAMASGEIDVTDVYSTDPHVEALDLVLLEDDRRAFPEYQAILLFRRELGTSAPAAVEALRRLEGRIDGGAMRRMNGDVQLRRMGPEAVAAAFLREHLSVASAVRPDGLLGRVLRRTAEHLLLVFIALAGAVAVAVPLGVLASLRAGFGRVALGVTGLVQTIPSLALLVFMIPLLGIGARPAIAALFLYALLPIVRGTHTGLTGIAPDLREAASALGLPRRARLRLVELPLAMPSIMAGVRTSAVIAVGTATLGALIGAGGYGQPILTGLRLDSVPLILEGAVPAALLALAVEAAFGLAERAVVSRGLRLGSRGR
jgi:osmoprotectant transport system permease protein